MMSENMKESEPKQKLHSVDILRKNLVLSPMETDLIAAGETRRS